MFDNEFDLTKNSGVGVYMNPHGNYIAMIFYTETNELIQPKYCVKLSKENSQQLRSILKELEKYL